MPTGGTALLRRGGGGKSGHDCDDRWFRGREVWCTGVWPGSGVGQDGRETMLIALLIALGVDLIVVVVFAALVLGRRQWLKRQPGEFAGAIQVSGGDIDGLGRNGSMVPAAGSVTSWSGARRR